MAVKITYFVHGTTFDNQKNIATGWLPGELSPKGLDRAKALREVINIQDFDIVISSDLNRAIQSVNYVFENDLEHIIDNRLRECNYGDLNGKDNSFVSYEDHINESFPNGESMQDIEKRIKEFLEYLLENYDGKHVAIMAHKAPQLAIEVLINGKTWENAIETDWRKTNDWKPGWDYILEDRIWK